MPNATIKEYARSASEKISVGSMLTIDEVAAHFDISRITVHRLPLPSMRLGRSLRFDPRDVCRLVEASKEAVLA